MLLSHEQVLEDDLSSYQPTPLPLLHHLSISTLRQQLRGRNYPGLPFVTSFCSVGDSRCFAELQGQSAKEIIPAISQAIGFQPAKEGRVERSIEDQFLDYLRSKRLLLILDNFEQLMDGVLC